MNWLTRLWRRDRLERELDAELRYHVDRRTVDLRRAGWSGRDARRQACLEIGGVEQMKEACRDARGTRWLEDMWQDVGYTLRVWRQRPAFLAVALCTLGLGCGASTIMFAVVNGVLLQPLEFPQPERLLNLHDRTELVGGGGFFSYPNFLDLRASSQALSPVAAWRWGGGTIREPGDAEFVTGMQISTDFFAALGEPLAAGRAFHPDEDRAGGPPVAIISEAVWTRRYDRRLDALGSPLVFDGIVRTIVGVAGAAPAPFGDAAVFTPIGQNSAPQMQNREARPGIRVIARLAEGATLASANAELGVVGRDLAARYPEANAAHLLSARPLQLDLVEDVRSTLWLLLGAVGLLLVIACVNVAGLLLARALSRDRELAMRAALGASRGRLVRQCLTESALLGLAGGAFGVGLAAVGTRPFAAIWPGGLPRIDHVQIDWRVAIVAVAVAALTGLVFGLAPAWRLPLSHLDRALRGAGRQTPGGSERLHGALIAAEVGLAVILLTAAATLGRAVLTLSALDPGLDVEHTLAARVALSPGALGAPDRIRAAWDDVLDRAREIPGVRATALADIVPMREGENMLTYSPTPVTVSGERLPVALASTVTPDFLDVMRITLIRGRFFDDHDRLNTAPVVVIDDVLAHRAFGDRDPIGERLWIPAMGPTPVRIVGEVAHVRHWGLARDDDASVRDQIYYPFAQVPDFLLRSFSTFMSLTVRTDGDPARVIEQLRRAMRRPANDQALYEMRTMEQLARASLARQRFLLLLFGAFATVALGLACIGIYGVLAYLTERRVPEMGVRLALGATAADVVGLVLRQGVGMVLAGLAGGMLAAFAAARALVRVVEGVQSPGAWTIAVVAGSVIGAALAASFLPALRASRLDPLAALRRE